MSLSKCIDQYTILTGDRSKIKDIMVNRLIECGWRDEVRLVCRDVLLQRGSSKSIPIEQLIPEVTARARTLVPDAVKKELLMKIRSILSQENAEDKADGDGDGDGESDD
ncbi:e-y-2 [Drosophila busckii]|uniref:Enhancer of yellow 2 transcription factor n=1 Tax=Drosophila busckii TaxID=30019 RepID=A0A0M3QVS0_DROBS|nr:enhancer of yellow 2 transcription factor [Drosophila busckii]ALC42883.1 e-y-2 [Drosophila busckii]